MKLRYILMCALAMISIAMQAQEDEQLYNISATPASEIVEGHIYILQNREYQRIGLYYDSHGEFANTFDWYDDMLGQCLSHQYFFLTAGAAGITLPVTLENINDNGGDMGYGATSGGRVLSPRRNANENVVYFTVADEAGQLVMYNDGLYGVDATNPAPEAQWIAYEVTEHTQHEWHWADQWSHTCSCGMWVEHEVENCVCTGCNAEVHQWSEGVCEICEKVCQHEHLEHEDAKAANCVVDGWEEYYWCECGLFFTDAEGTNQCDYDEDILHERLRHDLDENLYCHREGCGAQITFAENSLISLDVAKTVTLKKDESTGFMDPAFAPLYTIESETDTEIITFSSFTEGMHVSIFDKDFRFYGDWILNDTNEIHLEEAGNYYLFFTFYGEEEDPETKEGEVTITITHHHNFIDGVCTECEYMCQHENLVHEEAQEADCINDGNIEFYRCEECDFPFADAEGKEPLDRDDIIIPSLGHNINENLCCERCQAQINITETLTPNENHTVTSMNSYYINIVDPTSAPLYQIVAEDNEILTFSTVVGDIIALFDKDFHYLGEWPLNDEIHLEEAGNYYLFFTFYGEEEDPETREGNVTFTLETPEVPTFTSLEELLAAGQDYDAVNVTIDGEVIAAMPYPNKPSVYYVILSNGNDGNIQLLAPTPDPALNWPSGGRVTGTLTNVRWNEDDKVLSSEDASFWSNLTYTEPDLENIPTYNSIDELLADDIQQGTTVSVMINNKIAAIQNMGGEMSLIVLEKANGEQGIILLALIDSDSDLEAGGTLSGTLTNVTYALMDDVAPALMALSGNILAVLDYTVPSIIYIGTDDEGNRFAKVNGTSDETLNIDSDVEVAYALINRSVTSDVPASMMMPFAIEAGNLENGTAYTFAGVYKDNNDAWTVDMVSVKTGESIAAYQPFVLIPDYDDTELDIDAPTTFKATTADNNADINNVDREYGVWSMKGTYAYKQWGADDPELGTIYGIAGQAQGDIVPGDWIKATAGASILPMRAYIKKESSAPAGAKRFAAATTSETPRMLKARFIDGDVTGIGILNTETGEFSIEGWYDLSGRKIEKPTKSGIYVKGNKKVMIK